LAAICRRILELFAQEGTLSNIQTKISKEKTVKDAVIKRKKKKKADLGSTRMKYESNRAETKNKKWHR